MGFGMANDQAADAVLDEHPFAVVMGMMLDQQYGMEHAFRGPVEGARPVRNSGPGSDRSR